MHSLGVTGLERGNVGRSGAKCAAVWHVRETRVAEPPPQRPTPLDQDGLLGLFSGDAVGRNVVLDPASLEDMCGGTLIVKPSLEVIYDAV